MALVGVSLNPVWFDKRLVACFSVVGELLAVGWTAKDNEISGFSGEQTEKCLF